MCACVPSMIVHKSFGMLPSRCLFGCGSAATWPRKNQHLLNGKRRFGMFCHGCGGVWLDFLSTISPHNDQAYNVNDLCYYLEANNEVCVCFFY